MNHPFGRIAIVGMGLIGGSLGMALLHGGIVEEVVGVDLDEETLKTAVGTRAISRGTTDLAQGVQDADLVILATPVGSMVDIARRLKGCLKGGAVVTDAGSTKGRLVRELESLFAPDHVFVGGHPMAGSEKAGIEGADRYLFENAIYLLTPTEKSPPQVVEGLQALFGAMGARVMVIDPDRHDLLVAAVSHLPHMLAVSLVNTVGDLSERYEEAFLLAAGGFRDTTRIAAGNPVMWRDIALLNKEAILTMIEAFRETLDGLAAAIGREDAAAITGRLTRAKALREAIPAKMKGLLPGIHEVVVTVPDRPGVIGEMAVVLGREGINIIDIEILRVREGDGGTIRLGFQGAEAAQKAVETLRREGVIAKLR